MKPRLLKILFLSLCFLSSLSAMDVEETINPQNPDNKRKLEIMDAHDISPREQKRLKIDTPNLASICEQLPPDVMSLIFDHLPLKDLFNIRLVCSYFKTSTLRSDPDPFKITDTWTITKPYHYGWVLFYPNLRKLEIMDKEHFGCKAAKGLGQWLTTNTSLQVLDIQRTGKGKKTQGDWHIDRPGMGCEGAEHLAKGLKNCTSLTSLTLWSGKIGSFGANCIVEMLKNNSSITSLNLGFNSFADFGTRRLGELLSTNSPVKHLRLCYNSIGSKGIKALAASLENNAQLTDLDIEGNPIDDAGVRRLSEILKKNITLTTLKLNHNAITNVGCNYLAEMLEINSSLTKLELRSDKIDDTGVLVLQRSLENNTSLKYLSLDEQNISYILRHVLRNLPPFIL